MARSHHRHKKHHHPQYRQPGASSRVKHKGALVFIIFFAVFGLGIGYFAAGTLAAIIIGAVVGGAIGFLIGHNLDRMANRK